MAQNEIEEEEKEKESGGGFGRFMFFVTPILFTIVLLGVLLTLLNIDIKKEAFGVLNKIPIVNKWIPDDVDDSKKAAGEKEKDQKKSTEATINELKSKVDDQEKQLKKANNMVTEQNTKVQELQTQLDAAKQANEQKTQEQAAVQDEEYQKEVKKLAQLYGNMNAGKAAAIMENLTTEENVQLLGLMANENKTAILEKMDPKKAAEISIRLKDNKSSEDLSIAALQSRLKKESGETKSTPVNTAQGLDTTQLSQTFATMDSTKAAKLLLQTNKISPEKALNILHAVDDATRSKLLAAMSDEDATQTAKILNKLINK